MSFWNEQENEPGRRSGTGSDSLLHHLNRDTRVKTTVPHPEVYQALDAWESIHGTLRSRELDLAAAVRLYAEGEGESPTALMEEVTSLRAKCAGHFEVLLQVVKSQR